MIVGSIFDANQQDKTRLVNLFYDGDVIAIAKLKTWAPCAHIDKSGICVVIATILIAETCPYMYKSLFS